MIPTGPPDGLLPRPRSYRPTGERHPVPSRVIAEGIDASIPPQGYRLRAGAQGVTIEGADEAGLRYARATLAQLRHLALHDSPLHASRLQGDRSSPAGPGHGGPGGCDPSLEVEIAPCIIEDWPDQLVRAAMIDTARDRVPKLDSLLALIDRLASVKVNQVQLYTEHTFAYRGHEEVWAAADPYTPDDIARVRAHCESLGVELVANQNTLGHFERWLSHERYRNLAIAPDGFTWLFGIRRRATTLDPAKPGSLDLVSDILSQLVPNFTSDFVHVGLDEPWELDETRMGEWSLWLRALRDIEVLADKELLVWGDVPAGHPELLARLPDGVTVLEWGYEAEHPFEERCRRLAEASVRFWVCPGTSSWMSLTGRVDNMLANVISACEAALSYGASGFLMTDWGDMGHLQQSPVAEVGFGAGAALSWCLSANASIDAAGLADLLSVHCFDDHTGQLAAALVETGQAYRYVTPRPPNMSALALHILVPQLALGAGLTTGMRAEELEAVLELCDRADLMAGASACQRADRGVLVDEVAAGTRILRLSCRDALMRLEHDGTLASVPAERREELVGLLDEVIHHHRRLWHERDRPGGLVDSVAWLENLRSSYMSGQPDPEWFGPLA
jgi:hypothetical protein